MDNTHERYSQKEIDALVGWWNEGRPLEEISKELRRSKGALHGLIRNLRMRGYKLIDFYDRFEATRHYKNVRKHQKGVAALEASLTPEPEITPEAAEETIVEQEPDSVASVNEEPIPWNVPYLPIDGLKAQQPAPRIEVITIVRRDGVEVSRSIQQM